MIITDKNGELHSIDPKMVIKQECVTLGIFEEGEIKDYPGLAITLRNYAEINPITYAFATKEEAETVLKHIDERMEHPLMCVHPAKPVDCTSLEETKEYYEKAKQAEKTARQYYEAAYRMLQQQPVSTHSQFSQQPPPYISTIPRNTGGMAPKTETLTKPLGEILKAISEPREINVD